VSKNATGLQLGWKNTEVTAQVCVLAFEAREHSGAGQKIGVRGRSPPGSLVQVEISDWELSTRSLQMRFAGAALVEEPRPALSAAALVASSFSALDLVTPQELSFSSSMA